MRAWTFKPDTNRLESDNEVAQLTGKASAILEFLASRSGEVISQDDIRKAVWRDVHVTPDLVREYIFDLRQALGDQARQPNYIETVRGKGYRLIGGVDLARSAKPEPGPIRLPRIAVLRPDVLDGGPRWQRFADGMADELITDLARFSDIAVIARLSSFAADKTRSIEEIASDLNCDYVMESSLSVFDDKLRVRFQLIDRRDLSHAWAETYEREIKSLPKISSEVALSVAFELGGFTGAVVRAERRYACRRPASELNAYENYVIACRMEELYDQRSVEEGFQYIKRALELDPNFARSHLMHAFYCDRLEAEVPRHERKRWQNMAAHSAESALHLDTRDPLILSFAARTFAATGEVARARNAAVRAADMSPNEAHAALSAAASLTLVAGDYKLADQMLEVAFTLTTTPPDFYAFALGRNLLFSGRPEEAEAAVETGPDFESTYVIRCLAQGLQGKSDLARQTYSELMTKYPHFDFQEYPESLGMVSEKTLAAYEEAVSTLTAH